ncbi:MAG: nitroreductase family deazaflavin-dependent oxidoreductase [Pedococcus sp.]
MPDWNQGVIEEFRANGGQVGGPFAGAPILLLHTIGAKSGSERTNPMMYQAVGESFAVFASRAGDDHNPDWYHNLLAHPDVTVEVGTETLEVTAHVLDPQEREPIWHKQKTRYPGFAKYEAKTTRVIPVVMLDRR